MPATGEHARDQGPACRQCRTTEARCAWNNGCCGNCSHFKWLDNHGNERAASTMGGRPLAPVVDAVTAKRREQWRARYQQRRVS